jgi:hypothetical protein
VKAVNVTILENFVCWSSYRVDKGLEVKSFGDSSFQQDMPFEHYSSKNIQQGMAS